MGIDLKLIDQLLAENGHRPEDIPGENLKAVDEGMLERAMHSPASQETLPKYC